MVRCVNAVVLKGFRHHGIILRAPRVPSSCERKLYLPVCISLRAGIQGRLPTCNSYQMSLYRMPDAQKFKTDIFIAIGPKLICLFRESNITIIALASAFFSYDSILCILFHLHVLHSYFLHLHITILAASQFVIVRPNPGGSDLTYANDASTRRVNHIRNHGHDPGRHPRYIPAGLSEPRPENPNIRAAEHYHMIGLYLASIMIATAIYPLPDRYIPYIHIQMVTGQVGTAQAGPACRQHTTAMYLILCTGSPTGRGSRILPTILRRRPNRV